MPFMKPDIIPTTCLSSRYTLQGEQEASNSRRLCQSLGKMFWLILAAGFIT